MGHVLPAVLAVVLVAVGNMAARAAEQSPSGSRPPNIVLIISDDQAWTDYSFMGHPHIKTPRPICDPCDRQSIHPMVIGQDGPAFLSASMN